MSIDINGITLKQSSIGNSKTSIEEHIEYSFGFSSNLSQGVGILKTNLIASIDELINLLVAKWQSCNVRYVMNSLYLEGFSRVFLNPPTPYTEGQKSSKMYQFLHACCRLDRLTGLILCQSINSNEMYWDVANTVNQFIECTFVTRDCTLSYMPSYKIYKKVSNCSLENWLAISEGFDLDIILNCILSQNCSIHVASVKGKSDSLTINHSIAPNWTTTEGVIPSSISIITRLDMPSVQGEHQAEGNT